MYSWNGQPYLGGIVPSAHLLNNVKAVCKLFKALCQIGEANSGNEAEESSHNQTAEGTCHMLVERRYGKGSCLLVARQQVECRACGALYANTLLCGCTFTPDLL